VRAGFLLEPGRGKGGHRGFFHPDVPGARVILSGQRGDDAKRYQEQDVRDAIAAISAWRTASEDDRS
jgi:hypothetical protein